MYIRMYFSPSLKLQKNLLRIEVLLYLGTRSGWGFSVTPRHNLPQGKTGTHCIEPGWALGPFCTGAENIPHFRDSILPPSRPYAVVNPTTLPYGLYTYVHMVNI